MGIDIFIPDCLLGLGYFYIKGRNMTKNQPIAFFDPQEKGFYWAKPTKITAPTIVDVEPLALYTRRKWIGLTEDEIVLISADCAATHQHTDIHFARAIEAKLKEKNG